MKDSSVGICTLMKAYHSRITRDEVIHSTLSHHSDGDIAFTDVAPVMLQCLLSVL